MGYLFGIIGNPIKHTLSPWIHEGFMEKSGLTGIYRPIEIPEDKFKENMDTLKRMHINGFNVTIPYKEKMMEYVDEIDGRAQRIGAINTVVNKDGKWIGYNTDGGGYIRSLKDSYPELFNHPHAKKVLLIGAGGGARGIYDAFNEENFLVIDIANRTKERAEKIKTMKKAEVKTNILSLQEAEEQAGNYDIIVQTTSIGLTPDVEKKPIELHNIKKDTIVSDIIYNPIETSFLKSGRQHGAKIHHGHGMLLFQAALAFEHWTGVSIDPANKLDELANKVN